MALAEFFSSLASYEVLMKTVDPEEEPYRSKYVGREVLLSIIRDLETKQTGGDEGSAVIDDAASPRSDAEPLSPADALAICRCKLGINFLITEENSAAEKPLILSADHVAAVLTTSKVALDALPLETLLRLVNTGMEAGNYLALLYSGWDAHAKALDRLAKGRSFFDALKARVKSLTAAAPLPSSLQPLLAASDSLFTHLLFYLAQVHGHLGSSALTHRYIEATLQRQLNEQELVGSSAVESGSVAPLITAATASAFAVDRNEWVRNAIRLSTLYCSRMQWVAAAHCLSAADVVLAQSIAIARQKNKEEGKGKGEKESGVSVNAEDKDPCSKARLSAGLPMDEALQRLYSEVAVHWARLYVDVLKTARERQAAFAAEGDDDDNDEEEKKKGAKKGAAKQGTKKTKQHDESLFFKPWNRRWASKANKEGDDKGAAKDDDGDDPFSTAPMPKWSNKNKKKQGEAGDDDDDDKNMDDQEDSILLSNSVNTASASVSSAGASGREAGPFARFLLREGAKISSRDHSSYGPLVIDAGRGNSSSSSSGGGAGSDDSAASSADAATITPACPGLCLSGLKAVPLPSSITSFDGEGGARDTFRAINAACTRALQFFVLDGFVSDHVDVSQLVSRAYKYLAHWETDARRCAAMHQRRVDLISPLVAQLNTSIFLNQHKELSIEAGSAAQEVFELKQNLLNDGNFGNTAGLTGPEFAALLKKALAGASDAADKSIAFYGHFLRCYSDPRLKEAPIDADNKPLPPLQGASATLDELSVDAYLQTHFAIARILSKRTPLAVPGKITAHEAQVKALKAAGERFAWLVKTAESGLLKPKASLSPAVQSEVSIAKEMAALLPEKIALLTRQYQAAMSGVAAGAAGGGKR